MPFHSTGKSSDSICFHHFVCKVKFEDKVAAGLTVCHFGLHIHGFYHFYNTLYLTQLACQGTWNYLHYVTTEKLYPMGKTVSDWSRFIGHQPKIEFSKGAISVIINLLK